MWKGRAQDGVALWAEFGEASPLEYRRAEGEDLPLEEEEWPPDV